jgi:hypothetical protein
MKHGPEEHALERRRRVRPDRTNKVRFAGERKDKEQRRERNRH